MDEKKIIIMRTPAIEYAGCSYWRIGYVCDGDIKKRKIATIEKIKKPCEVGLVDWYQIFDEEGNLISEVRGNCLEQIVYE